jgi:hypothetical protein
VHLRARSQALKTFARSCESTFSDLSPGRIREFGPKSAFHVIQTRDRATPKKMPSPNRCNQSAARSPTRGGPPTARLLGVYLCRRTGYTLTFGRFRLPRSGLSSRRSSRFRSRRRRSRSTRSRTIPILPTPIDDPESSPCATTLRAQNENCAYTLKNYIAVCRHAIPHRLFMSGFRPASLTACPPREPPPLFEQEHRSPKELIIRR